MTLMEAVENRHSVRKYIDKKIEPQKIDELNEFINENVSGSGLKMQIITDEPEAFGSALVHYGMFRNVKNYIAVVGKKGDEEKCGYYGEMVVLKAQQLGLNTCWVALTFKKSKVPCVIENGEKLLIVIALGYGENQGVPHKNKPIEKLYNVSGDVGEWFFAGMKAAQLAPTAVNQQKFLISAEGRRVRAKALLGPCSKMDLGIVKYHFEIGAGKGNFEWID